MFPLRPKLIEDFVLDNLQHSPILILELIKKIKQQRAGTTKEGVYTAIRNLKYKETVVTTKGVAALSAAWLDKLDNYVEAAKYAYAGQLGYQGNFLNLRDREKIQYTFQDISLADALWNHHLYILLSTLPSTTVYYSYIPHYWFFIARHKSESDLLSFIRRQNRTWLINVGGQTPLDVQIAAELHKPPLQFQLLEARNYPKRSYHLNVIDDFIIEVWVNAEIAKQIDAFFAKTHKLDQAKTRELEKIIAQKGKTKYVISRNARKAARLRRKLSKGFVLPRKH